MMLVLKGVIEIYVTLNDYEFTLEYLRPGDLVNHNLFLFGKRAEVFIRCLTDTDLLMCSIEKMNILR
jgi:CRP-like cAMP-binding protein